MHKMKAISSLVFTRKLLRRNVVLCMLLVSTHACAELVTTQTMLPKLVHAQHWSEVEQMLCLIVGSCAETLQQAGSRKKEVYQALAQDCVQYERFLERLMINPETCECCQRPYLFEQAYVYVLGWAKKNKISVFFDFYACYWQICAYLFAAAVCDAQVAVTNDDFKVLLREAGRYLKTLESTFLFLETSRYDRQYAQLLTGYEVVFQQLKQRGRAAL